MEHFQFQSAAMTLQPDPDRLKYSLIGAPSWLSLDEETRTLRGTPKADDVRTPTFTIAAAGEAGRVANMVSKLLVTDTEAPSLPVNLSKILDAGLLSAPDTLSLLPSSPFSTSFPHDTFRTKKKSPAYYATRADHTFTRMDQVRLNIFSIH